MASDELQKKIDDRIVSGWKLKEEGKNRAIMVRRSSGPIMAHVIIFAISVLILLTYVGWWSVWIPNFIYAAYKYFFDSEQIVVRVDEDGE